MLNRLGNCRLEAYMYESDPLCHNSFISAFTGYFSNALDLKLCQLYKRSRHSDRGRFDRSNSRLHSINTHVWNWLIVYDIRRHYSLHQRFSTIFYSRTTCWILSREKIQFSHHNLHTFSIYPLKFPNDLLQLHLNLHRTYVYTITSIMCMLSSDLNEKISKNLKYLKKIFPP